MAADLRDLLPAPVRALRWRLPWMRRTAAYARDPARAWLRAARFTLAEMRGRDFEFAAPDGARLATMPNNFSSFALCVAGARDPDIWRFVERRIAPGALFVDAGANIGTYAVPAARLVGPTGRVVAFEAHPRTHALLARNLEANGLSGWADAVHRALGEAPGEIEMVFADANPGETHVAAAGGASGGGARVRVATLDAALAERGLGERPVDYLKVDVEGFELPVLRGALGTVARSPAIVVQTEMEARHATRYGHGLDAVGAVLAGAGLRPHHLGGAEGIEPRPIEGALRGDVLWFR